MDDRPGITRTLVAHFFRRFFDNDTVRIEGDTLTTVVRALSIVAVPGLMVAFFLQNQYWRSPPWVLIEDQYFFVLLSFVVMGAVSIFEWEMLFPDRLDFLVLSPLSLKAVEVLTAKAAALGGFLGLFLFGSTVFGTLIVPMLNPDHFLRQMVAHGAAVLMAGTFAALFFLALGGVLLCVLDGARFRLVSPVVQALSVMALVLVTLHYALYGGSLPALLAEPLGRARWLPTFWFLGVYEHVLLGEGAPAFAREMSLYAIRGTAAAAAVVLLTYPVAWVRMRKLAVEGASRRRGQPSRWLPALVHGVIRRPEQRAAFHFIGQTIRRNNRYQAYLAVYCGTGFALAVACAVTLRVHDGSVRPAFSNRGLHAVMPLLLFWVLAGLRTAFAFPLNLAARWVFRVSGVRTGECATAARRWASFCAAAVTCCVVAALCLIGWDDRRLLVQVVCGVCLCVLLTDGFLHSQQGVPFNQPRMPGRSNFPLMLTLYVGVLTPFLFGVVYLEMRMERKLWELLVLGIAAAAVHAVIRVPRRRPEEIEEEMEGYEGEFQLLGLS